jgi:hypothetical protein
LFTIHKGGQMRVVMPLTTGEYSRLRENMKPDKSGKPAPPLDVVIRVKGMDSSTWKGTIADLDESEVKSVPQLLSSRAGGPIAVAAPTGKNQQGLIPQTQHYLVYIDIVNPDPAIAVGAMAQTKIYLHPETCLQWAWRTINDVFNLRLM